MKVFLGFGYNKRDKWIREQIIPFIESLGHTCLTGEKMQGERLSEGVLNRIKNADVLIGFLTRRDRIEGQSIYTTHKWVTDELAIAIARKIPVFEIREEGIETQRGLTGDRQFFNLKNIEDTQTVCEEIKSFLENTKKYKDAGNKKKILNFGIAGLLFIGIVLGVMNKEKVIGIFRPDPVLNPNDTVVKPVDPEPEVVVEIVDTTLQGSLEFHDHPNLEYNLSIIPYYLDAKEVKSIEPISNVTTSEFEARKSVLNKDIGISIQTTTESLKDWVIYSTGKNSIQYEPNKKLVLRKKNDYYYIQFETIKSDIENNYSKIANLAEIDWISADPKLWYPLKKTAMDFLFTEKRYSELDELCRKIENHKNFEKLQSSQRKYVFFSWSKALRVMIEIEHRKLDDIYKSIGYVSAKVIENDPNLRRRLRLLLNVYNKYYATSFDLTEKDLTAFFGIKL